MEKLCQVLKEEIEQLTKHSLSYYEAKDRQTFNMFMDRLKTTLFNYEHMCGGVGAKMPNEDPPLPRNPVDENIETNEENSLD